MPLGNDLIYKVDMIETHSVRFSYPNGKSFNFPDISMVQGDSALLIGASGTGKTTYMNLISGMEKSTHGEIKIAGINISHLKGKSLDRFRGHEMAIVFQESHLVSSLTLEENLSWRIKVARVDIEKDFREQLMNRLGLKDLLKRKVYQLSIGEKQRSAIALALITKPKVVFADEPTSSLDDANANSVVELFQDLGQWLNFTLLIITHDQRLKDKFKKQFLL